MLEDSSYLYYFLHQTKPLMIHFFHAEKAIADFAVAKIYPVSVFRPFRDAVINLITLSALLKDHERFGFYIENTEPRVDIKVEFDWRGDFRSILLPAGAEDFPAMISGQVRLVKHNEKNSTLYNSVNEVQNLRMNELFNSILQNSFQICGKIYVSQVIDQGFFISLLPDDSYDHALDLDQKQAFLKESIKEADALFDQLLTQRFLQHEDVVASFAAYGFNLLFQKPIRYHCNCERRRFAHNLRLLAREQLEELFSDEEPTIEVQCDYCQKRYHFTLNELTESEKS